MSVIIQNAFDGKDCEWILQYLKDCEPPEVSDLLTLLCCLGGVDVSVRMLLRTNAPRIVWGSDGEMEGRFERDLKVGDLASAVSAGEPVKSLVSYGLVVRKGIGRGDETLSVAASILESAEKLMPSWAYWRKQAMILVCHTFPRGRDLRVPYGIVGNQQLPVLKHVLKYFLSANAAGTLSLHIKHLMAETLLAASTFSDFPWKYKALAIAEEIILTDSNPYLMMWACMRRSTLYRLDPNHPCCPIMEDSDVEQSAPIWLHERRANALHMRLLLGSAQAAVEVNMFAEALSILEDIKPLDSAHPSTMERMVLRDRDFAIGRVYRFQGLFKEALERFKLLLPAYSEVNKSYCSLLSHLSNTFVELGDATQAEEILLNALSNEDIDDKYFQIALAEANLHLKSFSKAEEICEELKLSQEAVKHPDMNALMFYLRILTILARIAHLEGRLNDALTYWESCLEQLKKLENFGWDKDGFTQMICSFSIADIKQKMGDLMKSRGLRLRAEAILEKKGRQHWVAGLGTIWLDAIRTSIEVTGTELAIGTPERWWTAQIDVI